MGYPRVHGYTRIRAGNWRGILQPCSMVAMHGGVCKIQCRSSIRLENHVRLRLKLASEWQVDVHGTASMNDYFRGAVLTELWKYTTEVCGQQKSGILLVQSTDRMKSGRPPCSGPRISGSWTRSVRLFLLPFVDPTIICSDVTMWTEGVGNLACKYKFQICHTPGLAAQHLVETECSLKEPRLAHDDQRQDSLFHA
jgi:hypothetical protein